MTSFHSIPNKIVTLENQVREVEAKLFDEGMCWEARLEVEIIKDVQEKAALQKELVFLRIVCHLFILSPTK